MRYSEIKLLHESIALTVKELPDFPGSNWMLLKRTNSNDELIEERRQLLNIYFEKLCTLQKAMNSHIMKSFLRQIKQDYDRQQQKIKNKLKKSPKLRAAKKLHTTVTNFIREWASSSPLRLRLRSNRNSSSWNEATLCTWTMNSKKKVDQAQFRFPKASSLVRLQRAFCGRIQSIDNKIKLLFSLIHYSFTISSFPSSPSFLLTPWSQILTEQRIAAAHSHSYTAGSAIASH